MKMVWLLLCLSICFLPRSCASGTCDLDSTPFGKHRKCSVSSTAFRVQFDSPRLSWYELGCSSEDTDKYVLDAPECPGYIGTVLELECKTGAQLYSVKNTSLRLMDSGASGVIMGLKLEDAGEYQCISADSVLFAFNVTVSEGWFSPKVSL